jgi:hypothetical protein
MSNLETWAMNQVNSLSDIDIDKKNQYKEILDVFGKQGHSGFSASYVLSYINKAIEEGHEKTTASLNEMLEKCKDDEEGYSMQKDITENILEILDLFNKYEFGTKEARNISRLMNWKPIVFVTGAEDEWSEPMEGDERKSQQNKVCSAVFRDDYDNSTAHYIDGKVFSDNGGHSWYGNRRSHIPVEFPFWVPDKPEYVYLNGENSDEVITDEARIKELYDLWT